MRDRARGGRTTPAPSRPSRSPRPKARSSPPAARAGVGATRPRPSRARRRAGRVAPGPPRHGTGRRGGPRHCGTSRFRRGPEGDPDSGGAAHAEILMFKLRGGTGARPALDGLSATAFPSGRVGTMSVEATEHVGADHRLAQGSIGPGSGGGAGGGHARVGLGQVIEIGAARTATTCGSTPCSTGSITPPSAARGRAARRHPGGWSCRDAPKLRSRGAAQNRNGPAPAPELPGGGGAGATGGDPAYARRHRAVGRRPGGRGH